MLGGEMKHQLYGEGKAPGEPPLRLGRRFATRGQLLQTVHGCFEQMATGTDRRYSQTGPAGASPSLVLGLQTRKNNFFLAVAAFHTL